MTYTFIVVLILWTSMCTNAQNIRGWPGYVRMVEYKASIDKSDQPMLVYNPDTKKKRPLLVCLHTWSGNYKQAGAQAVYARWCRERDWHFIHPDFRGPNSTPDACGSDKVVQDIIDAVDYMVKNHNVDENRIYLIGSSGGGHAALLMAGRAPDIWAGVSAWVPISDIRAWWEQTENGKHHKYAKQIEQAVGGRPEKKKILTECAKRSPIIYLKNATRVNLDISAGVTDGNAGGSVPFSHSLHAFNAVVPENERISPSFIKEFYEKQALPSKARKAKCDPLYGRKQVIFRKVHKNTRVSIFQGGHEIIHNAGLNWLAGQRKDKPAKWEVSAEHFMGTEKKDRESGK